MPLTLVVAFIGYVLVRLFRGRSLALTYMASGLIGVVAGVLWTYVVALMLGPFFGAWSFPALWCWTVGAASGLIVTAKSYDETRRSLLIAATVVIVMGLVALLGDRPLFILLSDSRKLEVVSVRWKPGSNPLSNPSILGMELTNADLERLKSIGLTGQVELEGGGTFGDGKYAKAIIVIREPLKEPTTLPQPDGTEVIYVQSPQGWKMYPANAKTLRRNIQLSPDKQQPEHATVYFVENSDGSLAGGTLVTW
jgi:hypothetical protein